MTGVVWRDELTDRALRDELDARHPERTKLRPTDVAGLIEARVVLDALWAPTIERARQLPTPALHERVNGEYSFVETFRHLIFAWEAWLMPAVRGVQPGYHEWALPPELPSDLVGGAMWSIDGGWSSCGDARPELDEVLEVLAERKAWQRDYLSSASQADLDGLVATPGWHPQDQPALYCFRVVLHDEWWHNQFATRDLTIFEERA